MPVISRKLTDIRPSADIVTYLRRGEYSNMEMAWFVVVVSIAIKNPKVGVDRIVVALAQPPKGPFQVEDAFA